MSALKSWPNFSFDDLTNIQLQNFRSSFSLNILTKIQLQNLDQISASKSWPRIYFSFKISTNLSSTRSSASLSAMLTKSRSFELASSKARVTPVKSQQQGSVTRVDRQWSDLCAKTPNMAPSSWIDLQGYPLSSSGFAGRSRKGELWRMSTSIGALDVEWPQSSPLPSSVSSWLSAKTWNWIAQVHWFGATRGQFIENV